MKISPARKIAYKSLFKIEKEKAFSSIVLSNNQEFLEKKDRSLCHKIVLGVLRKKLYLDAIIKKFTKNKFAKLDLEVLIALRIGIYQLLFLDKIPSYSAINESVNLVKFAKKKSAGGLVNAILRKVSKGDIEIAFADKLEKVSIETSHPKWLLEKWISQFGKIEAVKIAESNNTEPNLSFRLTKKFYEQEASKKTDILEFIEENSLASKLLDGSYVTNDFSLDFSELATKGFIYFQDEGSQIVAHIAQIKKDESFFDVCASPGSKTTYVGKDVALKNNLMVAGDIYQHRLESLKQNCLNQNVSEFNFIRYDAQTHLPFSDESFEVVLVDSPCSGTGTIRSNPEIRYSLKPEDFQALSSKQLSILQNASKTVKRNGRLIYSTCSIEREENEKVVEYFLEENKDFRVDKPMMTENLITKDNFARLFSHQVDTDGFFIAVMTRL